MKVESKLFGYLVIYFVVVGIIYAVVTDFGEWVGIVGLLLTAAMTAFVAWFFWLSGRNVDPRPEDDLEGEIADQTGDYGHFAPYSWWPLWLGLSTSIMVLGVAVGWWLVVVTLPFVAVSVVGWTFEYFRGARAI